MSPVFVQFIKLYMKRMTTVSATKMPPICAGLNAGPKSVASIWYITTDNTQLSSRNIYCKFPKQCLKFYFCAIFSSSWKAFHRRLSFVSCVRIWQIISLHFSECIFCKRNLWFVYRVSLQIMFVNWFFSLLKISLNGETENETMIYEWILFQILVIPLWI